MIRMMGVQLLLAVCLCGCAAQPRQPVRLEAPWHSFAQPVSDALVWDFGQVKAGQVLQHSFVFMNRLTRTLAIKDVTTSCGCTVSDVAHKSLEPGQSTQINVSFNSAGYAGQTSQFVYVMTDDPGEPILKFTIKADVK